MPEPISAPRPMLIWKSRGSRRQDWNLPQPWLWMCRVCRLECTYAQPTLAAAYESAQEHIEAEHQAERLQQRIDELQQIAANMLNAYVHKTHPGYQAMRSRHVDMAEINRWREVVWPTPQRILEK